MPQSKAPINPWLVAITVTIAAFMELLDTSIANVALPYIGGGLGRSYDEVTWILTTYLVANAVVLPMSAWLSRLMGRKTYYLVSVAMFTMASFFCGIDLRYVEIALMSASVMYCRLLWTTSAIGPNTAPRCDTPLFSRSLMSLMSQSPRPLPFSSLPSQNSLALASRLSSST